MGLYESFMVAIAIVTVIGVAIIGVAIVLTPHEYTAVSIHDLVENPQAYEGQYINTTGYLGDTGEYDFTFILIPIVISTGKTTTIIWVPISDWDYYFAVYTSNAFDKGIVIKLEHKEDNLLGTHVIAKGKVCHEEFKIKGDTWELYIIKGSVDST